MDYWWFVYNYINKYILLIYIQTATKQVCNEISYSNDNIPQKRANCTLNYYENNLYLYGGNLSYRGCLNDLWKYSIKTNKWKELKSFKFCQNHESIIYKHNIIFFGGKYHNRYYNDIYSYNIKQNSWKIIETINKPSQRIGHSLILINDIILIYGGRNKRGIVLNDCYILNISNIKHKNAWINIDMNIGYLTFHSMTNDKYKIICFGGKNIDLIADNNLIIIYNINCLINQNQLSILIVGYLRKIEKKYTFLIQNLIKFSIQNFVGLIKIEQHLHRINPRYSHKNCPVAVNNKQKILVFGGFNVCQSQSLFLFNFD